jgi:hypothetical protein
MASSFAGVCERLEDAGNSLQETEVNVENAEEILKSFPSKEKGSYGWVGRKRKGRETSGGKMMAETVNL